jgi:sigma-E factor negative regulatory protein RseA
MNERISALMDGELDEAEAHHALVQIRNEAESRNSWDTYHLIGDALRDHVAPGVAGKVRERLALEPTVLAPQRRYSRPKIVQIALSAAAGMAGIALVAWMAFPGLTPPEPQVAAIPAPAAPAAVGVDDYLLAHQSFSPSGAMQGVASYVRTVSDTQDPRK